jgi:integrase
MGKQQGHVIERNWKAGRGYALRFVAYDQRRYLTLGLEADGWTRKRAEEELANVMADVRRGIWTPPARRTGTPTHTSDTNGAGDAMPTFHAFSSNWLAARKGEVSEAMYRYLHWALTFHLLGYFADHHLDEITIEVVDDYRRHKLAEAARRERAAKKGKPHLNAAGHPLRPLGPSTINKTIEVLQAILATAVEYEHITKNPAAGRRRRLKVPARRPVYLDTAHQIIALLEAASILDATASYNVSDRRANVACLVFAGPRAHEHTGLRWRDVDLTNNRIHIARSKTQAGLREIDLLPILHTELAAHRERSQRTGPDNLVFQTTTGTARDKDNLRNRILAPVLLKADELLIKRKQPPLPTGVTPHKLRHTFASILVACGEDPASVMAQLGHTDPTFTLRIYTHLMRRDPAERQRLKDLVNNESTTPLDSNDDPGQRQ